MARPKKTFKTKAEREAHEKKLAARRARHSEFRTIQMASKAAEGEADFAELVEAEKRRQAENAAQAKQSEMSRKGGAQSPKVTVKARDDLALAFDLMGGVPALVVWGRTNPTEFYRLWARLIPREAAETSQALPLETLLEKLATRESQSVGQAAFEIGAELLEEGRRQAALEDADPDRIDPSRLN